jgi:hypothetical protein
VGGRACRQLSVPGSRLRPGCVNNPSPLRERTCTAAVGQVQASILSGVLQRARQGGQRQG